VVGRLSVVPSFVGVEDLSAASEVTIGAGFPGSAEGRVCVFTMTGGSGAIIPVAVGAGCLTGTG